jgi:hypothetical protein
MATVVVVVGAGFGFDFFGSLPPHAAATSDTATTNEIVA